MKKLALLSIFSTSFFLNVYSQSVKPFEEGDRVAFVGNSITEAGYYETYIWLYYMTRFPDRRIEVLNVGIGGDVSRQINKRLEADVFAKAPTVVVITFGMNDTGYFQYNQDNADDFADESVKESYVHFRSIVEKLKARPGITKIIMSSSPYDETMKNENNYFPGKSKAMERIVTFQKEEALRNDWGFVDLYYPMKAINLEGQQADPEFTITGPDRIHPGNGGHLVMAYLFLKEQGLAAPVADVAIDAKKGKVLDEENASLSNLQATAHGITFDYLARSLPFPVDTVSKMWGNDQKQSLALDVVPFTEEFNREMLCVKNLQPDKSYSLVMDGDSIGTWKGKAYEEGINLATLRNTPQYRQAWTIMNLANTVRNIENKLREYYWLQFNLFNEKGMLFQNDQAAVEFARAASRENFFARSKMESYEAMRFESIRKTYLDQKEAVVDLIYEINKPVTHKVSIRLVD